MTLSINYKSWNNWQDWDLSNVDWRHAVVADSEIDLLIAAVEDYIFSDKYNFDPDNFTDALWRIYMTGRHNTAVDLFLRAIADQRVSGDKLFRAALKEMIYLSVPQPQL